MFKKANRLTTKEFSHYFKTGKRHNYQHLSIIFSKSDTLKVSVVVGKKVAKSAVKRNMLKRRVLAALRQADLSVGSYIFLLKPNFSSLPKKTAEENINESIALFRKSK
jgi:ribonuclease P protein component